MTDLVRQEIATAAHTVIVKVGTRVLTGADGRLNQDRVLALAEELHQVAASGRKVALVTSGAVGAGMGQLGLSKRPVTLAELQAVAAVGQCHLIETYDRGLRKHGRHAAQLLLTAEDLDDRTRYLNVRNTILALFEFGAIPIINENDTVSVEELKTTFGDNDRLAAMVTNLIRAPLLGPTVRRRWAVRRRSGQPDVARRSDRVAARRFDQRPGPRQSHRAEQGGHGQQNRGGPADHLGGRKRDHRQRPHARRAGQDSGGRTDRHPVPRPRPIDSVVETLDRIYRADAAAALLSTPALAARSKGKDAACWRSASRRSPAILRSATSWPWSIPRGASSPAA